MCWRLLEDITKEEKAILQERLNKVWNEFKKEFNHEATFYTVVNEKKYEFNIYSEEFENITRRKINGKEIKWIYY